MGDMQHVFFACITIDGYNITTYDEQAKAEEWVARTMVRAARKMVPSSFIQLRNFDCIESGCTTHRS